MMLFSFVQMGNWCQKVKSLVQGHSTNEQEMRDSNSCLICLQSVSDPFHQGSVFYFFYKDPQTRSVWLGRQRGPRGTV